MTEVLSPLQRELVERFFARTQDFFLTGGAALAGFYFGHRRTGAVRLDSLQEILANKLCALLGRSEVRDLVDVLVLERRGGLVLEEALPIAMRKDRGATPGQLAWVLSQIRIGDDARIPAEIPPAELQSYLADLTARLSRLARPPLES